MLDFFMPYRAQKFHTCPLITSQGSGGEGMTKIAIEIDCDGKYCGECREVSSYCTNGLPVKLIYECDAGFSDSGIVLKKKGNKLLRCKQCLEAEVKE
jgi:hypothetical protein